MVGKSRIFGPQLRFLDFGAKFFTIGKAGRRARRASDTAVPRCRLATASVALIVSVLLVQAGQLDAVTRRISKQLLAAFPDVIPCHTHTLTLMRAWAAGGRAAGKM